MATGPEHYREAERLLEINAGHPDVSAGMDRVIAAAQVHATLALAADSPAARVVNAAQELLDVLYRHQWNTPGDVDDARAALHRALAGLS